jgi:ATP-dependent Clp protease ATP-binding subunit ClpA
MMDIHNKNWTPKVLTAWAEVSEIARSKRHNITNTYHLFLSLWNNSNSSFLSFLEGCGVSLKPKTINELVDKFAKKRPDLFLDKNSELIIEKSIQNCIKSASDLGERNSNVYLGVEHFMWAILESDDNFCELLLENGIDTEHLKSCLESFVRGELEEEDEEFEEFDTDDEDNFEQQINQENKQLEKSQLGRFCILLNDIVNHPQFGVISGRDKEIHSLEEILCCKIKSNCILVGEAGTGKTSVVEGLAQVISSPTYDGPLKNKKIYSLDLGLLIAGSKYRGQFESRFSKLLEELKTDKDSIVFIDEIHSIIGAGGKEGSPDLANLIKPALARGDIKCIGATTSTEYKQYFEKDSALSRRFHHVYIDEPSIEQMKSIARKAIKGYEKYHELKFPVKTIDLSIDLCETYLPHKRFIDKAFDVIDRSFAKAKMKGNARVEIEDVLSVVSGLCGVDTETLTQNLNKEFSHIADNFKKNIYGQDVALDQIYDLLASAKAGLNPDDKPLASFLFVGPTSVGKTYTAKKISEEFYGNNKSFLHLNMSEYQESTSISRLIGASAGYVGYEDGGLLTEFVRKNPNSLILFDEIEKCNPSILNLLLQILDEAKIKDNLNREIDLSKTIVVMTSNIGSSEFSQPHIGFAPQSQNMEDSYSSSLRKKLSPEILARIQEVIVFQPLQKESIEKIFNQYAEDLINRANKKGIKITSKITIDQIEKNYGSLHAREVHQLFRKKIQTPVAHYIAKNNKVKKISIKVVDNRVVLD